MATRKAATTSKKSTPLFEFKLSYETAAALQNELCALRVHAETAAKEGHSALLTSCQQSEPFYKALCDYLSKYQ